jgi:hypothetical protein
MNRGPRVLVVAGAVRDGAGGGSAVTEAITYYAVINQFSSLDKPSGVIRRVENNTGHRDELFSPERTWKHTSLLYSAEHGDLANDMVVISAAEAARILGQLAVTLPGQRSGAALGDRARRGGAGDLV